MRFQKKQYASLETVIVLSAFIVFILFVAALCAAFPFPPVLDFANHYARLWLLAGGIKQAPFNDIYQLDWTRSFTNIGMDLLAVSLGPVLGVPLLAKILLFLAILLPPFGAICLHLVIFGRLCLWQIGVLFFAWCSTLIGGFINFQLGLGFALIFAALEFKLFLQKDHRRDLAFCGIHSLYRVLIVIFLTLTHIFAVGFYLAVICGLEAGFSGVHWRHKTKLRQWLLRVVWAVILVAATVYVLSIPATPLPESGHMQTVWNARPITQVLNILSALTTYVSVLDVLFALPIFFIGYIGMRKNHAQRQNGAAQTLHAGLMLTMLLLLALSCLSPRHVLATGWISWRFPIMMCLVLMAMIQPWPRPDRGQILAITAALCIAVFGRSLWIGENWRRAAPDVDNVISLLAHVPQGARVLPLSNALPNGYIPYAHRYFSWREDVFRHWATLAVPYAHAFVPTIFTAKGKQPLMVKPAFAEIAVPEGSLYPPAVLLCPMLMQLASHDAPYLTLWQSRFDYALLLNADQPDAYLSPRPIPGLSLIAETPFAKLFKIDRNAKLALPPADCPADFG